MQFNLDIFKNIKIDTEAFNNEIKAFHFKQMELLDSHFSKTDNQSKKEAIQILKHDLTKMMHGRGYIKEKS